MLAEDGEVPDCASDIVVIIQIGVYTQSIPGNISALVPVSLAKQNPVRLVNDTILVEVAEMIVPDFGECYRIPHCIGRIHHY